jgi:hypothetical protein
MREFISIVETMLREARAGAALYHWMEARKAFDVLTRDTLPSKWIHDVPDVGQIKGTSLSRNKRFDFGKRSQIRLTLDQMALSQRYKIMPLDGEAAWRHKEGLEATTTDRANKNEDWKFSEEFLIGDVSALHKYITEILLVADTMGVNQKLYDVVVAYAYQWKIHLRTDPVTMHDDVDLWRKRYPNWKNW